MGHSLAPFLHFRHFKTIDGKQMLYIKLLTMTGFELRTSGAGSDISTN